MGTIPFQTWDVFTKTRFFGNQLAVVFDAGGLSDAQMQTIAAEFNLAESVFISAPDDSAHTAKVRIFTPKYEMPFAGHPTVGASIAIATAGKLQGPLHLELKAGLFRIELSNDDGHIFAEFENPNLPSENHTAPNIGDIEAALSLPAGSVSSGDHRPRIIGAGVNFLYVHASLDHVRSARVNSAAFDALGLQEAVGVLLYAEGGDGDGVDFHVRMFAPGAGVAEDAATGSAAAALPGQLALAETLRDGEHHLTIEQGIEMGRPSIIKLRMDMLSLIHI